MRWIFAVEANEGECIYWWTVLVNKVDEHMWTLAPLDQNNGVCILLSFTDLSLKERNYRKQERGNDSGDNPKWGMSR